MRHSFYERFQLRDFTSHFSNVVAQLPRLVRKLDDLFKRSVRRDRLHGFHRAGRQHSFKHCLDGTRHFIRSGFYALRRAIVKIDDNSALRTRSENEIDTVSEA